ncbi:MAG TPA: DUF6314 family protein [Alphaproteobacteria bacterium]|nr:DUF6314 family protein [Alphaproteobacteria bacterium]
METFKMGEGAYGVDDLRAFLEGGWTIMRTIRDRRAGVEGRFVGVARFLPTADGLDCRESGRLVIGAHDGPAEQLHRYRFPAQGRAEIRFRDDRPFHALDLTTGAARAAHACPPDRYRARFRVIAPDIWCAVWQVRGPRKDLIIASRFTRNPDQRLDPQP